MRKINVLVKLLSALIVSGLLFQSCLKSQVEKRKADEKKILEQYIKSENITVSPSSTGLYYIEEVAGTGSFPQYTDWVEFTFTGRLVSNPNTIVMTSDSVTARENFIYNQYILYGPNRFKVSSLFMAGLIEGISKMKEGGIARIIFPSDLGYGDQPVGNTPSYSSLIIDIKLIHVIPNIDFFERAKMSAYLLANNITEDSTSSGLVYHEITAGTGVSPITGSLVTFTYKGTFLDGKVFSQRTADDPYVITSGQSGILQGLDEGITLMKKGGKARLVIPYYLAFGANGYTYQDQSNYYILIWPYSTLVYDIEIINVRQ